MSVRVADRVDGWDQRPFDGGFEALHDLADEAFSGVVRAGGAEAYLTMGTVVAVRHGSIEDFESATGTVFSAPDPALPLLAVMQAADADVRAQYYSEETPISEVDGTLSSGGFTGFVELSENVLSGDYFLVYHGGESMSVAFVGNNDELLTEDEAFQTADDEVGIYKVRQVDVEPVEIPEPTATETAEATAAAATADGASESEAVDTPDDSETEVDEAAPADADEAATTPDDEPAADAESASGATDETGKAESEDASASGEAATADPDTTETSTTAEAPAASEPTDAETTQATDAETAEASTATSAESEAARATESASRSTESAGPDSEPERAASGHTAGAESGGRGAGRSQPESANGNPAGGSRGGKTRGRAGNAQSGGTRTGASGTASDLETRSVPSLDPSHTHVPERATAPDPEPTPQPRQEPRGRQGSGGAQRAPREPEPEPTQPQQTETPPAEDAAQRGGASEDALSDLESDLADREAEIERLEADLTAAESDREDLEADLATVREERDELAAEVERLESELERLEQEFGAATDAESRMTPTEAIEATNLFVEYDTKGNATLADAHEGTEGREAVAENLRLGVHTEFDDRAVAVGGEDFDEFLQNTLHYRFAEWVVGDLLFEIRDTGNAEALPDLYDAIREIRRVEFNGVVDVEYTEEGQDKSGRERFDVIFRHRMGDPLLVANLNDSREPATGNMMTSLVTSAERVGQTEDGLASAFLVTSSFFESEALETVSEATQGGLLSRDSRRSFVNLSRKEGYHLCLVAARDGNFHMEVPEL